MNQQKKPYLTLFLSTLQLSAFTFGGGYVIISLMRKKFVEKLGWLENQEMLDLTAIAQSSPGPIAVNASLLVGYRMAGIPGALLTALGTVLPPFFVISVVSLFYAAFRDNYIVSAVMKGMQAGIAAVIFDVVLTMGKSVLENKRVLSAVMLPVSFIAAYFFKINIVIILLCCAAIGAADALYRQKRKEEEK